MQAVQSALAIRRQRKRRDEHRRAKNRRYSSQSVGPDGLPVSRTPRPSIVSADGRVYTDQQESILSSKAMGTMTMFHVGMVLVILGLLMITASLVPGYITRDWDGLLGAGIFFLCTGIFLCVMNRIVTNKEDEELANYVQKRLGRSKSGQRLIKDVESGGLTPKPEQSPKISEEKCNSTHLPLPGKIIPSPSSNNGDQPLDKIVEENENDRSEEELRHQGNCYVKYNDTCESTESTNSLSPSSPNENQVLLQPPKTYSKF